MLKLFVGNLPPATRENDVRSLFAAFGTVRSVDLAHDIFTGKCKGFCFVEMEGHEARAAQAALDGKPMAGTLAGVDGFLKVRMENPLRAKRGRR
jgi:RNA recognition motif-containing protein